MEESTTPTTFPLSQMLSAEKSRHLRRLTDEEGRFSMLAVDQRQSLRRMIARRTGADPEAVAAESLTTVKEVVASAVAPLGTAVLMDPEYGHPEALEGVPEEVGVLMSAEVSGYEAAGGERRSRLLSEWNPERLKAAGADGVKLLIWHHAGVSEATRRHQERIVKQTGAGCAEAGLPFLLEVKTYPLGDVRDDDRDGDSGGVDWARRKPEHILDGARVYSAPRFGVDLLKMEFPAFVRHTEERQEASFGRAPALYDRGEVQALCQKLDEAAAVPWVILSAGVDLDEFLENVRLANAAGASGFLCGRTIWKGVMEAYPEIEQMRAYMQGPARSRFEAILEANAQALPLPRHRCFRNEAPEGVAT
jgi:tagatose 1,6-diphosphate aldolase